MSVPFNTRRLLPAAAVIVMSVLGLGMSGGSAQAVDAPSTCPSGKACGYYYTNYNNSASHLELSAGYPDLRDFAHSGHGNWDNQFSSVFNNRIYRTNWFTGYTYSGSQLITYGYSGYTSLSSTFGNAISSVSFYYN